MIVQSLKGIAWYVESHGVDLIILRELYIYSLKVLSAKVSYCILLKRIILIWRMTVVPGLVLLRVCVY